MAPCILDNAWQIAKDLTASTLAALFSPFHAFFICHWFELDRCFLARVKDRMLTVTFPQRNSPVDDPALLSATRWLSHCSLISVVVQRVLQEPSETWDCAAIPLAYLQVLSLFLAVKARTVFEQTPISSWKSSKHGRISQSYCYLCITTLLHHESSTPFSQICCVA